LGLLTYLRGDDLLGAKALTGTSTVLEALAARQFSTYQSLGGTNLAANRVNSVYVAAQNASYGWIYRYSPPVRAVVDWVASNVAQLGLKVYERISDDERRHAGDHPAARALRNPNPQTPGEQFIFDFVAYYLVFDNAYALKFPGPNEALTAVIVPSGMVGLVGQSIFAVDAYRIWRTDGTFFDVPPERMIHWRGYNPDDPRKGESKLETLREELAADSASRQATTELYRSGLRLPGWVERPIEATDWSDGARKRFQSDFSAQALKARREVPVLEEGMVFKQAGVTPEDAELIEARRYTLERIAGLYGMKTVPPEGPEERAQFYSDVLQPLCERLCSFFDLQILVQEYGADDYYTEFNLDEKLMGDDRLRALTSAAGVPPLTRNEARARLNLPAKKGGDELITPLNVVAGDNPKPSPQVMPIQSPNGPPQDGSHRSGEADQPLPAGTRSLNGHTKDVSLIPRRARADHRRNGWAKEYKGVLLRHFERQERAMQSKSIKAVADERYNRELADDLDGVFKRQFEAEGKHVAFRLNNTFNPDYGQNWLAAKSIGVAEAVNLTTKQHIEQAGAEKAFTQAKDIRAEAGGMALATDVAAFSTRVGLEQDKSTAQRSVVIDGGTCDVCAPYQGEWPANDVPGWPAFHSACQCVCDVY
jgi:HK97 family phage portal protein